MRSSDSMYCSAPNSNLSKMDNELKLKTGSRFEKYALSISTGL